MKKCYEEFKKYFSEAVFINFKDIREYAIKEALQNNQNNKDVFYLEFGVFSGNSINFFQNMYQRFMDLTHFKD